MGGTKKLKNFSIPYPRMVPYPTPVGYPSPVRVCACARMYAQSGRMRAYPYGVWVPRRGTLYLWDDGTATFAGTKVPA